MITLLHAQKALHLQFLNLLLSFIHVQTSHKTKVEYGGTTTSTDYNQNTVSQVCIYILHNNVIFIASDSAKECKPRISLSAHAREKFPLSSD
jgi:hypothetical protein